MKLQSTRLACFSPTGTTMAIVEGIANGMDTGPISRIDITRSENRHLPLRTSPHELLIVGAPVYMGRIPALLQNWFQQIDAHQTPTVCVVVYGNRAYDNALLELKDLLSQRGCIPIAAAAFIGEHSFSSNARPIALCRPNDDDSRHALVFGQKVSEKLATITDLSLAPPLVVPGDYPYAGITDLWNVDFISVSDACNQCGHCATICPMTAIDNRNSHSIDTVQCITCCACIKKCPRQARTIKPGPVDDAASRLFKLYSEPKQPQFFL